MAAGFDWQKDYLHRDPAYGLNDWESVVAFVRGLLENAEDEAFCWPNVRLRVMAGNTLMSQTMVQHMGRIRDRRGIPIIIERLGGLGAGDLSLASPWCPAGLPLERLCLEALASIGGPDARAVVERYRHDPAKTHLAEDLRILVVADEPRPCTAPYPPDYPAILQGVRSIHDLLGEGGCEARFTPEQAAEALAALRSLPWYGHVEHFSGDGETTVFEPKHRIVDHVHDFADRFSDFGIFLSNPKVEYPLGRRRWANSHTFLAFQIPDGALYGHEYHWDLETNTIHTHFHEQVSCEPAVVNPDGRSVTVGRRPISTGVEVRGNVLSRRCSSAVRGVWSDAGRQGPNHYVRRANVLMPLRALYYFRPLHEPVVNQLGIWDVDAGERPERFFRADGTCNDETGVIEELLIPLHEPKVLCWTVQPYTPAGADDRFTRRLPPHKRVDLSPVPPPEFLDPYLDVPFVHSHCGTAGVEQHNDNGYHCGYDINSDGIIDRRDREILDRHRGQVYRMNVGDYGYFGFNWLSLGNRPRSHDLTADPRLYICAYDYGAGYDADAGVVQLFDPLPPGQRVYVEYFHDVPPASGRDNVKVYLHRGMA